MKGALESRLERLEQRWLAPRGFCMQFSNSSEEAAAFTARIAALPEHERPSYLLHVHKYWHREGKAREQRLSEQTLSGPDRIEQMNALDHLRSHP